MNIAHAALVVVFLAGNCRAIAQNARPPDLSGIWSTPVTHMQHPGWTIEELFECNCTPASHDYMRELLNDPANDHMSATDIQRAIEKFNAQAIEDLFTDAARAYANVYDPANDPAIQCEYFGAGAYAHHSPAAHYILDERTEIVGVVTEFRPVNPHARIYLDVTNEAGDVKQWMAEGGSIVNLRRVGWTDDQLRPGDEVRVFGRPSRFGANLIEWTLITLPDGSEVGGGNGQMDERLMYMESRLKEFRRERDR